MLLRKSLESVVIVTWCQKCCIARECKLSRELYRIIKMSILCKPPESLSFTGNVTHNWQDFVEQLQWFLEGTESTEKGDNVKIGIMLSYAGKEAREIYKTLPWATDRCKQVH